jgi:hypothetical protein
MGCPVSLDLGGAWFHVGSFHASWTLNFDTLTAHMLFTVTGVSMAVHVYAADYMRSDPHQNLFMSYLSMFTGFMLVLVAADNLMLMMVGWEGKLYCPNGYVIDCPTTMCFFIPRIPAVGRHGLHSSLFKQLMLGFLLGDGWLEKHGKGARLCISLTERFRDVAEWLMILLYGLGYSDRNELGKPLRPKNKQAKPYYLLKTFTFASLLPFYDLWYPYAVSIPQSGIDVCMCSTRRVPSSITRSYTTDTLRCVAVQERTVLTLATHRRVPSMRAYTAKRLDTCSITKSHTTETLQSLYKRSLYTRHTNLWALKVKPLTHVPTPKCDCVSTGTQPHT